LKKTRNPQLSLQNNAVKVYNDGNDIGHALHDLMEIMRNVKTKGIEAKLNATTISDGRGGRIKL